ncbi:MAG: hypothetical protein KAQ71_13820 [Desulfobulbaceae bacterium]|nr:hypothetical protein [Desulfobulbaceae bacterium]
MKIDSITELRSELKNKEQLISVTDRELVDKILKFKNIPDLSASDIPSAMICMGEHVDAIMPLLGIDRELLASLHTDYDIDGDSVATSSKENINSIILKLRKRKIR